MQEGLLPVDCLAEMTDQLVAHHQLAARIPSRTRLLEPVQQVPLRAGIVPAAHVLIHLLNDPLLVDGSHPAFPPLF